MSLDRRGETVHVTTNTPDTLAILFQSTTFVILLEYAYLTTWPPLSD